MIIGIYHPKPPRDVDPAAVAQVGAQVLARADGSEGAMTGLLRASQGARRALEGAGEVVPPRTGEQLRVMGCPSCGAKLRLPVGKERVLATCPGCAYRFVAGSVVGEEDEGGSVMDGVLGWMGWR